MRCLAILLLWAICTTGAVQAQRSRVGSLRGIVVDSASSQPIEAATVSVFLVADSSLVSYAMTNKKGEFIVRDIPQAKPCRVLVSYSGLSSYTQDFIIAPETKELLISTVQLRKFYDQLEDVVVAARRPPVLIKKDTIEYDAGSFKTSVNGVMEDLLRLLPGLEVDENGGITYQGRKIAKITVDGKDFFGNDFKIASKNLPKDIIDKVQVVDLKTREALFNNIKTGREDKAINITLKKDKKRGVFGRAAAGLGTDKRYESGTSLNYLDGPLQLNFIGNLNSINRINLTEGDLMTGKPDQNAGGSRGITETKGAGLNFGNVFGEKLTVNGSYFYNHAKTVNSVTTRRQNFLGDTGFVYHALNNSKNTNDWHKVNGMVNYKLDSLTDIYLSINGRLAREQGQVQSQAGSASLGGQPINNTTSEWGNSTRERDMNAELFMGRRLGKPGRSITFSVLFNGNERPGTETNKATTFFYQQDGSVSQQLIDQQSNIKGANRFWSVSASYTEPLTPRLNWELKYTHSRSQGDNNRWTNQFNPVSGRYDLVDTVFSNAFQNKQVINMPSSAIHFTGPKWNGSIGAGVQWLDQQNNSEWPKAYFGKRFINIFPSARISYPFSKTGNITLNYAGRSQQPTIEQLQPVPDNRNTLYLRLGNPDLKPSFYHNLDIGIEQFSSRQFWTIGVGVGTVKNQVVEDTWFDSIQVTRPVNSDGNYTVGFNSSYSYSWRRKNWTLRLSQYNNGYHNRNVSYSNKLQNVTNSWVVNQRFAMTFTYKSLVTVMPAWTIRFVQNRYSMQPNLDANTINHTVTGIVLVNWPKKMVWEQNWQYVYNARTAPGFPKGITLWNMAVNYHLLKDSRGVVRLSVYDLLHQNTSVNRIITPTFIEDSNGQVLQRYWLLTFLYNLQQMRK
ncbi:TonB-dependent receptor [Paraflavitalea pollutisoli]|uniref:TonB-dependent receptor n=1 Tax=Paraflavitalea pollutisoli TaxID=3034143 RepID=UPI0023ECD8C4|nr:TonB-dependent receptor [Paraflavitalea sp. H1-2-19X]